MSDQDTIAQLKEWHSSVRTENRDFMARVAENFRFATLWQWGDISSAVTDEQVKEELQRSKKPALTYNEILPKLNILYSQFLENLFEPSVSPRRSGTATAAYVLKALLKHIMDLCDGNYEDAQTFLDGITGGIGNIAVERDYKNNPLSGDIILRRISPFDVLWDWGSSDYNPDKSCRFVTEKWYWTKEQMLLEYPKKPEEINTGGLTEPDNYDTDDITGKQAGTGGDYEDAVLRSDSATDRSEIRRSSKQYEVKQTWWKKHERGPVFIDRVTEKKIVISSAKGAMEQAKARVALEKERYLIRDEINESLVSTTYSGAVMLEEKVNPNGPNCTKYPIRRYFPYYFDGVWFGPVDNLKDPQREVNKRMSQTLHAINSIVRFFFLDKEKGGAVEKTLEALLRQETRVVKYKETPPDLVVANLTAVVAELSKLTGSNTAAMDRISSVSAPSQGRAEYSGQAGYAINQLIQQTNKSAHHCLVNMSRTRQECYEVMVELITNTGTYTEWEMMQIVEEDELITRQVLKEIADRLPPAPQEPQPPNPQVMGYIQQNPDPKYKQLAMAVAVEYESSLARYQEQVKEYERQRSIAAQEYIYEQIQSLSFGRYGTKISQKPMNDTLALGNLMLVLEMRKSGIMVPDDIILKLSNLPEHIKDELIERFKQMQSVQSAPPINQLQAAG